MKKEEEDMASFVCPSCGELFSTTLDLSKHFADSSCGVSGDSSVPSGSRVVALTSEGELVTVTTHSIEAIPFEEALGTEVVPSPGQDDSPRSNEPAVDEEGDRNRLSPGSIQIVPAPMDDVDCVSTSPITVSLLSHMMPTHISSDSHVLPGAVVIPISDVHTSVSSESIFVSQDSRILNLVNTKRKSLAVVSGDPQDLPSLSSDDGKNEVIEPHLPVLPTTVHLQPGLISQVAMEIHIPVHSQLIVNDYVEGKESEKDMFLIADKETTDVAEDKISDAVLSIPQIWSLKSRSGKRAQKRLCQKGVIGDVCTHRFCCEFCGKTYSKSSNLNRHKRIHTGAMYPCSDCDKQFRYKVTLKNHIKFVHNKNDPLLSSLNKCMFCHRLFSSTLSLGIHLRTHTYEKPVACKKCNKTFMTPTGLKRHQLIHNGVRAYSCDVCDKKFLRKSSLKRHKILHLEDKPFKCVHCYKSFADKSACGSHERLHNDERPFACQYCLKSFKTAMSVKMHETIHTRLKRHDCSQCSEKFGTSKELKMHMRVHWKAELKEGATLEKNQCKECGAKFTQRVTLKAHERTHTGELPYSCEICHKGFGYYSSWRRHLNMHKGEKPYVCKKCGKGFTKKVYLTRHKKGFCSAKLQKVKKAHRAGSHEISANTISAEETSVLGEVPPLTLITSSLTTNKNNKFNEPSTTEKTEDVTISEEAAKVMDQMNGVSLQPFACEVCGKMYKIKSSLQRHLKTHKNKKPFPCDVCGKGFSRPTVLDDHKMMIHGVGCERATFQCTDCVKSYPSLKRLEIHRRVHTGERPHKCPLCEKHFKETSTMKRHLQVHANKKSFKCIVCGRGFNDKGNLQKHEATHGIHGDKDRENVDSWTPFSCALCGKTFKQLGYLCYHMRIHDTKEPFSCTVCNRSFSQAANLQVHMKTHTEPKLQCPHCSKSYRKQSKLEKHIITNHDTRKSFICGICGKLLATKTTLKRHEEMHSGIKLSRCPICQENFRNIDKLKSHLQIHEEEVFLCDQCGQTFLSANQCEKHQTCHDSQAKNVRKESYKARSSSHCQSHKYPFNKRSVTPKSIIFVCDICNQTFDRKKMLSKHKKAHRKGKIHV